MVYPREVLNELKWHHHDLEEAVVTYIHRGAPGDVLVIKGSDITELGRSYFETKESSIPYHRIVRIVWRDDVLFGK
ncbi:MAG TPA: RNA repair domain-containing protein [Methanomassiliicoccales archaeon]|nr:RNA repair domain-containing protein [Methanomassiliicoccales archaeon]